MDPFQLLAKEDPDGTAIGAVLVQEAVPARWSGAARHESDSIHIEGVAGAGDRFMLGEMPPGSLPADIERRVVGLCTRLSAELGPLRIEWADDGHHTWVLQLNQVSSVDDVAVVGNGRPLAGLRS